MADAIYEIQPDEVKIEGKAWDSDEVRMLWAREEMMFTSCRDFHEWLLDRGHVLSDQYVGKIFTESEIAIMEDVEDKVVVQPKIMKGPIRALVGQIMKSRRSGNVTTEGGSVSDPLDPQIVEELEVANGVLKHMEQESKEKYILRDAVHDAYVACYPTTVLWDKIGPFDKRTCGGLKPTLLPWDSCVFGPLKYREPDGGDVREMFYWDMYTKKELLERFPTMDSQINAHFTKEANNNDEDLLSSISQWAGDADSETKDRLYDIMKMGRDIYRSAEGLIPTVMHLYPIMREEECYINFDSEEEEKALEYKIRPGTWDDGRWSDWIENNKDRYEGPFTKPVITLWSTVWTATGCLLSNGKHWYQNHGQLPIGFFVPCMINGVPDGPGNDLSDDTKANAIAETEFLDDVRKGSQKLLVMQQGTIANAEDIPTETTKAVGVIWTKQGHDARSAVSEISRVPNNTYKVYADQRKESMYETTRINETMQGGTNPRQSAIAKQLEIAQALVVNAIYVDNYNMQWEKYQNLKLALIPYAYTEEETLYIMDEKTGESMPLPINTPEGYDLEGEATHIVNDLSSADYRYRLQPVDDSPSAKEQNMQSALVFINAASGPLISADKSGKFFARVLMSMPNPFLNEAGRALAEDAKIASEQQSKTEQQETMQEARVELMKAQADIMKAEAQGKSFSVTGEQLAQYPALMGVMNQMGFFNAEQAAQPQPSQQPVPQGAPVA